MPRGLPLVVRDHLDKAKAAAVTAVEVYNRPGPRFRTAHFVVLIVMAWTALLHAIFYKRNVKPWYRRRSKTGGPPRYEKVDGEPKHWDLAECLKQYHGDKNPPERKNLDFLIGLRNKIEHRHLPHLDPTLFGECQAALMNLETQLVESFGQKHALADQLGVALQFSQLRPEERSKALSSAVRTATGPVAAYIEQFRAGLPAGTLESMKYSFSVFLVPKVANREKAADAAVRFVKVDEASQEELERLHRLNVLIRDKHIPIANLNMLKPSEVVARVEEALPFDFNMHHHCCAWRHFGVRPASDAAKPEVTDPRYCVYDPPHRDYVYTSAWVDKLIAEFAVEDRFRAITNQAPRPK